MASNGHTEIQFHQLEPFLTELSIRGPNVEPLVRIGAELRQARGSHKGEEITLPITHVYVCASYLRRVGDVLLVAKLQLYVGDRWGNGIPEDARTEERRQAALARLEQALATLHLDGHDLELVDGSAYA